MPKDLLRLIDDVLWPVQHWFLIHSLLVGFFFFYPFHSSKKLKKKTEKKFRKNLWFFLSYFYLSLSLFITRVDSFLISFSCSLVSWPPFSSPICPFFLSLSLLSHFLVIYLFKRKKKDVYYVARVNSDVKYLPSSLPPSPPNSTDQHLCMSLRLLCKTHRTFFSFWNKQTNKKKNLFDIIT